MMEGAAAAALDHESKKNLHVEDAKLPNCKLSCPLILWSSYTALDCFALTHERRTGYPVKITITLASAPAAENGILSSTSQYYFLFK